MAKKCSQKPQGSISTDGMKSVARASGEMLKQREAAEEEKNVFVVLVLGQVGKMTKSSDGSAVGVFCGMVTVGRRSCLFLEEKLFHVGTL